MSWDADLNVTVDGNVVRIGEWNHTHNCNQMANIVMREGWYKLASVLEEKHWLIANVGTSWWKVLDGLDGQKSAELLDLVIVGLEKEPERFQAMNPENGWGSYDTLLEVLREMREQSQKFPSGQWSVSG